MFKLRKTAVFCIFILIVGIFSACDDTSNPFSNNLGEKVVIEPPTISVESPVSGSFLTGDVVTFTGTAKAYIEVRRVEMFVFEDKENGQKEIPWTNEGITLKGGLKNKTWTYEFNTRNFNNYDFNSKTYTNSKDGIIRMKFRVRDSKAIEESIELIYIIKNNPSDIRMSYPDNSVIIETGALPKLNWGGEIQGQIIDRRGIRPGYPQIKLWPDTIPEPSNDDPQWGYASLFLPGVGNAEVGYDDIQKERDGGVLAGPGKYADRSKMPVVRAAQFSLRLAKYKIVPDPNNPELRRIQYEVEEGKHIPFGAGEMYNFRIRTKDTSSDPLNMMFPIIDDPVIEGFFPPKNFGYKDEDSFQERPEPVKFIVFRSDTTPQIRLFNDDIPQAKLDAKPNKYISESTSKKIAVGRTDREDFRLKILATLPGGGVIGKATLEYRHESSNRFGTLSWDNNSDLGETYFDGKLFTFTAKGGLKETNSQYEWYDKPIFTQHSEPYTLIVTVWVGDIKSEWRCTLYMDGEGPDVSIRSIKGAAIETEGTADEFSPKIPGGLINDKSYTVNNNIQILIDRMDDSGIMAYKNDPSLGFAQPDDGYPVVKWIIEEKDPSSSDSTLQKLRAFQADPTSDDHANPASDNLKFFNDITDSRTSGWVQIPSSKTDATEADKSHNFKFNTFNQSPYNAKENLWQWRPDPDFPNDPEKGGPFLWLYVIAQDSVQNLGFIVQKIKVDDDTDKPQLKIPTLFKRNASDKPYLDGQGRPIVDEQGKPITGDLITGPGDLDVNVDVPNNRKPSGNWSEYRPRRNILDRDQPIELNFFDDDGINLDDGGVIIKLTVLDPVTDIPPRSTTVTLSAKQVKEDVFNVRAGSKAVFKDISGVLSQKIMAEALYGSGDRLKDGMYKIEITVKDDLKEKVALTPPQYPGNNPGDTPDIAYSYTNPANPDDHMETYFFAVFTDTEVPLITIKYPDDNALGSKNPITIQGEVKSRLNVRSLWITFTPDVLTPSDESSAPQKITLNPVKAPGTDGYYIYAWEKAVVFHPDKPGGGNFFDNDMPLRRFEVEAYDRLGNVSKVLRTVEIDVVPPEVTLIDFNNGRSIDPDGTLYVYKKVAFTVSASDANGLMELTKEDKEYSGIKWWVFPVTAQAPDWNTTEFPIYQNGWVGGGNFLLNQARNGGRYIGVIDTRKLTDKDKYRLFIIAMDKAGNLSDITAGNSPSFTVDQDKDYPVIDPNSLNPLPDDVRGQAELYIQGTVSDADLFNPLNRNTYVKIRFPYGFDAAGLPNNWRDEDWIPITINEQYTSKDGGIDPSGAIVYKFDPNSNSAAKTYLSTDGIKYYQIKVTDEPVESEKNYGKNPDLFMANPPQGNPLYPGYIYEQVDEVSRVFPIKVKPTDLEYYRFYIDITPPVILFDKYDPNKQTALPNGSHVDHPNYSESRPTYSKWDGPGGLIEDLSGWVEEYKLSTLSVSYMVGGDAVSKVILNNPTTNTPGRYNWSIKDLDAAALKELSDVFDSTPQGLQIIVIEATDMVPANARSVSWIFSKDTQGPDIIFNNITRSILHNDTLTWPNKGTTVSGGGIPLYPNSPGNTAAAWPDAGDSAWPYDWRYGPKWSGAWNATWRQIITNWPSEYAFVAGANVAEKIQKVREALKAEHDAAPSIVSGDPESMSGDNPYNPPVIQGTFSDQYSSVRKAESAGNPNPTYFFYRFKNKEGDLQDIPSGNKLPTEDGWLKKEIEKARPGQNAKTADWEIVLNEANGFKGEDGENWLDIKIQDTAGEPGNEAVIFNARFLVDRKAPVMGQDPNPDDPDNPGKLLTDADEFIVISVPGISSDKIPGALREDERVFSGRGFAGSNAEAFTLQGRISDHNLSSLQITIAQDGAPYVVVASVVIDPVSTDASITPSTGTGVISAPVDKVDDADDTQGQKRLKLSGPFPTGPGGAPEWTWELKVLQKDIEQLRAKAAEDNKDSARRYIRVNATDKAKRRIGPVDWYFYLDTRKPDIEYTNMDKGRTGTSFESNVALSGLVSDDTKIRDVKYMIARWDYAANSNAGDWRWYNSGAQTWTLTTPPGRDTWPSAFDILEYNSSAVTPREKPATSMNWTINQKTLNAANKLKPNTFEADLFNDVNGEKGKEGQYRLELYVTDYSLGSGNPHYTLNIDDSGFEDKGKFVAAFPYPNDCDASWANSVNDYKPNVYVEQSNASGRVFYIDKKDPRLEWVKAYEDKTYFRNENGQVIFGFIAGDGNTIREWEAVIRDEKGNIVLCNGNMKDTSPRGNLPVPATVAPTNPSGQDITVISIEDRIFELKPFMTSDGTISGTPLDLVDASLADPLEPPPKTFNITITVKDGANRSNSITKQFILDNRPPVFDKFQPASFVKDQPTTRDAVTGRLNIRGNTADNSNQIKRVAFYVPQVGPGPNYTGVNFPNPAKTSSSDTNFVPDADWLWYDSSANGGKYDIKTTDGTTVMRIEDGTFAWRLIVPQTSLFFNNSDAKKYAQIIKTKGTGIDGTTVYPKTGDPASDYQYRDVVFNYNSSTNITTAVINTDSVPVLTFPDLANKTIYGGEQVGLITVYMLVEDMAGNFKYEVLKYWIWPEGDRPHIISINNPDSSRTVAERQLNGTIRISGMAKDNERVQYVWFRVLPSTDGKITGAPFKLHIPVWNETTWEAATPSKEQDPAAGSTIGARRGDDPIDKIGNQTAHGYTDGWYKANGGGSRDVSWWAYINTNGELDPPQGSDSREITIEVRAQDVTWDDSLKNNEGDWKLPYTNNYQGFASAIDMDKARVTAWVVAGAPTFENVLVANGTSEDADKPNANLWGSIDTTSLRERSAYRVTVKHNAAISAIRWSPTRWEKSLNSNVGGFQMDPAADAFNLLDLATDEYVYYTYTGSANGPVLVKPPVRVNKVTAFVALNNPNPTANMAVTVKPKNTPMTGSVKLNPDRNYLIIKWDPSTPDLVSNGMFVPDDSYYETVSGNKVLKDLKNTVFRPIASKLSGNIGNAVLLESDAPVTVEGKDVRYFKWDVTVDARADLLAATLKQYDPNYENTNPATGGNKDRAGQNEKSVRYPVYLSASENSRATPLTTRGDTLLPIDNLPPTGMYTLNRRPAGVAATIGGTANDDGPVNGLARVVLWFQRWNSTNTGDYISWHDKESPPNTSLSHANFIEYQSAGNGPAWWDAIGKGGAGNNVIPTAVKKPYIPQRDIAGAANGVGASAIVIDQNNQTSAKPAWGHELRMGFADGGKYWYVEINSFGIESGPIYVHFVVIDKAGNAAYYREKLVIMNGAPVIDRIKLATDIRDNSGLSFPNINNRTGNTGGPGFTGSVAPAYPILEKIRDGVPLGGAKVDDPKNDVKKGISDWISSSALQSKYGVSPIIDFNVRNNLFGLRIETTAKPSAGKTRNFRLEYVSSAKLLTNTSATDRTLAQNIKAGRIYIISDPGPGTTRWGSIGAEGDGPWETGYAFIAAINGIEEGQDKISGVGSVWELNSDYPEIGERDTIAAARLRLGDVKYTTPADSNAIGAEFVYGTNAFGTTTGTPTPANATIVDYTPNNDGSDLLYPPTAAGTNPVTGQSMFILRVFDGPENELFGTFTIIRIRVNNDDKSKPFAQIYDINPKTEGQDRQNIAKVGENTANELTRSISPMFIGEGTDSNRTKGGLWNNDTKTVTAVDKPGHIEPRKINYPTTTPATPYNAQQHSLSSAQMGGAATQAEATLQKPFVNPEGFFTRDTVSGRVVLRGYAEDDQRIQRVSLVIGGTTITILDYQAHAPSGDGAGTAGEKDNSKTNYGPPKTGLLKIGPNTPDNIDRTTGKVYFTDSIDLYRHRVEWAYIWDTETIPGGNKVAANNINVRVISYNRNGPAGSGTKMASDEIVAPGTAHVNTPEATRPNTSPYNKDFPIRLNKYNSINFNLRPYMTGFLRNKTQFSHDTRSRQGRYMFYRGETVVVKGFNLSGVTSTPPPNPTMNNPIINIPGAANITTVDVTAPANYGITTTNNQHYRQFTVDAATAKTDNGLVTYSLSGADGAQIAINTGGDRATTNTPSIRPTYIMPWNIEYSPGKDGSQLWDDFTQVHIWQSNNTAPGGNQTNAATTSGYFASVNNSVILNPAMSIDPSNGILYESHNDSGGGTNSQTNKLRSSDITQAGAQDPKLQFSDPIFFSDIYRSSGATWMVSSIIGNSSTQQHWDAFGGIYISGPGGVGLRLRGGGNTEPYNQESDQFNNPVYHGESTWYNASTNNSGRTASPPSTDQFMNPHIVTSNPGNQEDIHVSYYDTKDGSIKYRYNRRGSPGKIDGGTGTNSQAVTDNNAIPKMWTNLDGGIDEEDRDQTTYAHTGATISRNARVVRDNNRNTTDAGKHNSIAVTSQGYPVIAYYDAGNQRLKLAVSRSAAPVLNTDWIIRDYVIPSDDSNSYGTGEFVSMKIDSANNKVHIAAMNTNKRLVYVTGTVNPNFTTGNAYQTSGGVFTLDKVQIVDSVGNVGRWCALSLDKTGNPWISYMDESYVGARDGAKLAYFNTGTFYKGSTTYCDGKDTDLYGKAVNGWEAMHVPTAYRVENPVEGPGREHGRLGLECYPTRISPNAAEKFWGAALSYISKDLGMDRYHIAYYVK